MLLLAALSCSSYAVKICHGLVALGHSGSQYGINGEESILLDFTMGLLLSLLTWLKFSISVAAQSSVGTSPAECKFWRTNVLHTYNVR